MILPVYIALFLIGLLLACSTIFWFPEYTKYFIKEGGLVEDLGAILFLFSGISAAISALFLKRKKFVPILFSLMGLFLFLEEISWGWSLFRYYERPLVMGVKIDSAHDFFEVFMSVFQTYLYPYSYRLFLFLFVSSFLILLSFVLIIKHKLLHDFLEGQKKYFLGFMFMLLSFSVIIDMNFFRIGKFTRGENLILEEYFEFSAALALFFLTIRLLQDVFVQNKQDR